MAVDKNKIIAEATKLVQKGALDKAITAYQKILAEDAKDVRVLLKVGELYQKKGDEKLAAYLKSEPRLAPFRFPLASILRGKASEQDLYQSTLNHLADEYDMRLGQIDEGLKDLDSFMTKVDLSTGIVDSEAFALVDTFEKKLSLPARSAVVEIPKTTTGSTDYARLFGGKKE